VKNAVYETRNAQSDAEHQAPPDQNNATGFDEQQQVHWTFGLDQEGVEFEFDDIAFDQEDEDFLQGMQMIPNPHRDFVQPSPRKSQRKKKEVSLLERFGLLSNDQISNDESDEESIGLHQGCKRDQFLPEHPREILPIMKGQVEHACRYIQPEESPREYITNKTGGSQNVSSSLFPVVTREVTESEGRARQQEVPMNEKTLVDCESPTFHDVDDESSTNRFPPYSPGSSYDQQDAQDTQQEIERLKKQEETEKKRKRKQEKKRKRKEEKREKKKRRKEKKEKQKKSSENKNENDDELETPKRLDMGDTSPVKVAEISKAADGRTKELGVNLLNSAANVDDYNDNIPNTRQDKNQDPPVPDEYANLGTPYNDIGLAFNGDSNPDGSIKDAFDMFEPPAQNALRLVCSETFLEDFGNVVAELSGGDIVKGQSIQLIDTSIMEVTKVDIETPGRGAIVVGVISQIRFQKDEQHQFMMKIVDIAANARYKLLNVVLVVDSDLDSETSEMIVRFQNAVFRHEGAPGTITSFSLTSKNSLSKTIAETILNIGRADSISTEMEQYLADDRTKRRLEFLLALIPNSTVSGLLHWLAMDLESCGERNSLEENVSNWFHHLLSHADKACERLKNALHTNETLRMTLDPNVVLQLPLLTRADMGSTQRFATKK
jgi:hypothetical protein